MLKTIWLLHLVAILPFIGCGPQPRFTYKSNAANPTSKLPDRIDTERGTLSVENVYIPGVVACEIGRRTWGVAAMEAQAIAARTYLARFLERTKGSQVVPIGPRFQCWKATSDPRFLTAALETSGKILRYKGTIITGNYVSGTHKLTHGCEALPPTAVEYDAQSWPEMLESYREGRRTQGKTIFSGTAWTEIFVTRNEGKEATNVEPSPIAGEVMANRGAFGQNAAVCLANNLGYETEDILRYFYGEDIEIGE